MYESMYACRYVYSIVGDRLVERVEHGCLQVELDRTLAAQERGYRTFLFKLLRPHLTAKNDLLVGAEVSSAERDR